MEIKEFKIDKFVKPPIKLPDHTPVNGKGIATNKQRFKEAFFIFDECLLFETCDILLFGIFLYFSKINPVDFFLTNLQRKSIGRHGAIHPRYELKKAMEWEISGWFKLSVIANGMAILPSIPGIIAIKKIASHKQFSKLLEKNSSISF